MSVDSKTKSLIFICDSQTPEQEAWRGRFVNTLKEFFPQHSFQSLHMKSAASLLKAIASLEIPHVVILQNLSSATTPLTSDSPEAVLLSLYRKFDAHLPILRIVDQIPGGQETLANIDQGVTAFLRKDFHSKDLDVTFKEIFTNRFENHHLRFPRFEGTHKIQMNIASIEQAIVSETLNVGRGGLFVRSLPEDIKIGDLVEFELNFNSTVSQGAESEDDPITQKIRLLEKAKASSGKGDFIQGNGVVVWVRNRAERKEQPEGFGMNFLNLDERSATILENFVNSHGIRSYIPTA